MNHPPPQFATAAASFREGTEDRALVFPVGDGWVVCVADGTGGASGAALAAEMFVAGVRRAVEERGLDIREPDAFVALLEDLDHQIKRHPTASETTGIALALTPASLAGASAGDSRAWLFTADSAIELTADQVRKPRVGTGGALPRSFAAAATGTLVVGTDGLFDNVAIADIAAIARAGPPAAAAEALVRDLRGRFRALPDDVAVVVGRLDGV
ncbi:MAG TPA: SpoIIE family protein phosphatase [Polyangia bacterium]